MKIKTKNHKHILSKSYLPKSLQITSSGYLFLYLKRKIGVTFILIFFYKKKVIQRLSMYTHLPSRDAVWKWGILQPPPPKKKKIKKIFPLHQTSHYLFVAKVAACLKMWKSFVFFMLVRLSTNKPNNGSYK